ncbi:MAG: aldehyde dehydrogenase [Flavobacterium sp.]|nr:aldehyde dehydrogenase [Flavobacterium sp.]
MNLASEIHHRKKKLIRLLHELEMQEDAILSALYADFKKPVFEGLITETALVKSELKYTIRNINKWAKPKRIWPSLVNFPSSDFIYQEPYGKVLIISPWNYPFHLALMPVIAAFAAGNQVILKPSELAPHTSNLIAKIIASVFEKTEVDVIEGGLKVSQELLAKRWDYIFFTGSVAVGKKIAQAAVQHLTPVTLELGGKSPCVVDETANLQLAAKRIVWGKFLNAGQTCVAPDFLLVHTSVKSQLIKYLVDEIVNAYGENPELSTDLARIINHDNWLRIKQLLKEQQIVIGGFSDESSLYIAPTIVDEPSLESDIMKAEIFGPLLPILSYNGENELEEILDHFEKPLAFYVFSTTRSFIANCLFKYSFGGGCVNDVAIHLANKKLPFGGVGHSGSGAYHGKHSFDTFSHRKSVVKKANWLDIPIRYAPYNDKIRWVKKLLDWL